MNNALRQSWRPVGTAETSKRGMGTYSGVCKKHCMPAALVFDAGQNNESVDRVQTGGCSVLWNKALDAG